MIKQAIWDMEHNKRKGVHSLIAVCMLSGMSIVMGGLLLGVLGEYAEVLERGTECTIHNVSLYDIVGDRAYLAVSVYNMGSDVP